MDEAEGHEEHQEEVGEEVEVSCLPSKLKPDNSYCILQCALSGNVGRFSETTNSPQEDSETVEVEEAHEGADEVVEHQEAVEHREEEGAVGPKEARRP